MTKLEKYIKLAYRDKKDLKQKHILPQDETTVCYCTPYLQKPRVSLEIPKWFRNIKLHLQMCVHVHININGTSTKSPAMCCQWWLCASPISILKHNTVHKKYVITTSYISHFCLWRLESKVLQKSSDLFQSFEGIMSDFSQEINNLNMFIYWESWLWGWGLGVGTGTCCYVW